MKKIREFLPDDVRCEVNTALVLAIERYVDCTDREIEHVLADFLNIWDEKTTVELEGVEPFRLGEKVPSCGNCGFAYLLEPEKTQDNRKHLADRYCNQCGTKIKW